MTEPLLLLSGMMCDARLFAPQIAHFSARRAVMVAPLVGYSSFEKLISNVLADAPPRFALAGLSMGGIAAMEVIRQAPERVTRLALMGTNPLAEEARHAAYRDGQVARVSAGGLQSVIREELKPYYFGDTDKTEEIFELIIAMAEYFGPKVFAQQSNALRMRLDYSDTLRNVSVPTLILCGEKDALCPVHRHELIHSLVPGAKLVVIPGAGHLTTLEVPERVNEELALWLNS